MENHNLKSLFFRENKVNEFTAVGPSPEQDFYQFLITLDTFIWRWWKITPRNDGAKFHPGESKDTYEEFLGDERRQSEIRRVFGEATLNYALNVARGKFDLLPRLPKNILMGIFGYLELEDIIQLSYTCKKMHQVCNDQQLWKQLYLQTSNRSPGDVEANTTNPTKNTKTNSDKDENDEAINELAELFGWKRIFFTNKVQLQLHLRRVREQRRQMTSRDEAGGRGGTSGGGGDTAGKSHHANATTRADRETGGRRGAADTVNPPGTPSVSSSRRRSDDYVDSLYADTEEEELRKLQDD